MNKVIKTERLLLRPLVKSDADDVFEWGGDPIVNRYMTYPLYHDVNQVVKWIESLEADKNEFAFCLQDTGEVIGAGSVSFNPEKMLMNWDII